MSVCKVCGAENDGSNKFCISCGSPLETEAPREGAPVNNAEHQAQYQPPQPPQYQYAPAAPEVKEEKKPEKGAISVLGFIGLFILFSIPVVGLVFAIVWACGVTENKTLVNYARAWLILWAIALVIAIVASVIIAVVVIPNYKHLWPEIERILREIVH